MNGLDMSAKPSGWLFVDEVEFKKTMAENVSLRMLNRKLLDENFHLRNERDEWWRMAQTPPRSNGISSVVAAIVGLFVRR